MFVVILFIFLGIGLGYTLRTRSAFAARLRAINIWNSKITTWLICPLAPISSGGATTMDTTLPIITQSVGQRYVALSIYHGFVTDFTVPFLVTMWCTI